MKTNDVNMIQKLILFSSIFTLCVSNFSTLSQSKIENLIPKNAINVKETIMPLASSMVSVNYVGDIIETSACSENSYAYGGLKVEISWFDKNDYSGKMMLGFVSNPPDIEKHFLQNQKELMEIYGHYSNPENSNSCSKVVEEPVSGGKLHILNYSYTHCETERKQIVTTARCFFFNGVATGLIRIDAQCKPEEVKEMIKSIIKKVSEFDFNSLMK
jgi:hypothetical protein